MAKVNYNVITHGVSGKVGDLIIFSQRYGKTFIGKIPAHSSKVSAAQQVIRDKFRLAGKYAKACMKNPETKALYSLRAQGGVLPFNLAFADYFSPPVIDGIITSDYTGIVGSRIEVQATDDTKVTGVIVSIHAANGTLIETGPAVLNPDTDHWVYKATVANAVLAGTKIAAVASDLPGNTVSKEKVL